MRCTVCLRVFDARRRDARCCSSRCRERLRRWRQRWRDVDAAAADLDEIDVDELQPLPAKARA